MSSKRSSSNRTNRTSKVVVIIVLVLVLIFGIGQFFSFSRPSAVSPATQNQAVSTSTKNAAVFPPTQIISYVPQPLATSTTIEKGSCWTNSIAAPFRADAWRCTVGNSISDPCFAIPDSTSSLLCNVNPTMPNNTSTFALKLTKPLPASQVPPGLPPTNWAWLIRLADGTLCTPFTGTLPVTATGDAAQYGCAPGPLGKDVLIFNDLNASSSAWTAEIGSITETTSSLPIITNSSTVPVSTVWQ
jgi:hypothetical protein